MLQHYHKTFIMNCTVNDTKSCMWVCGCRDKGNLAVPLAHQKCLSKRIKAVFVNIHFISLPLFLKLFANSTRSVLSPRVKTVWCYSSHASLGNQVGNPQLSSLGTAAIAKERLCWGWGRRFSKQQGRVSSSFREWIPGASVPLIIGMMWCCSLPGTDTGLG